MQLVRQVIVVILVFQDLAGFLDSADQVCLVGQDLAGTVAKMGLKGLQVLADIADQE